MNYKEIVTYLYSTANKLRKFGYDKQAGDLISLDRYRREKQLKNRKSNPKHPIDQFLDLDSLSFDDLRDLIFNLLNQLSIPEPELVDEIVSSNQILLDGLREEVDDEKMMGNYRRLLEDIYISIIT